MYQFHTTCVNSDADSIHEMVELAGCGHQQKSDLNYEQLRSMLGDGFWKQYSDTATFFKQDPYINAHQSFYQGAPCVYIRASAIEHVYLLDEERLNADGFTYSRDNYQEFDEEQVTQRTDLIDTLYEASDEWENALIQLADKIPNATLRSLKGERFEAGFARLSKDNSELIQHVASTYIALTYEHQEQMSQLRILPASILQHSRHLRYERLDAACCVMDLICMYGEKLGFPLPEPKHQTNIDHQQTLNPLTPEIQAETPKTKPQF